MPRSRSPKIKAFADKLSEYGTLMFRAGVLSGRTRLTEDQDLEHNALNVFMDLMALFGEEKAEARYPVFERKLYVLCPACQGIAGFVNCEQCAGKGIVFEVKRDE